MKTRNELLDHIIFLLEEKQRELKYAYSKRKPWYSWYQSLEFDEYQMLELRIEEWKKQYD